jgi:predicted Fe-Mo cluster-binding NifX family protein
MRRSKKGCSIMKIAVTSQNFRAVTGHAGRARRFLIYDVLPDAEPVEVERLDLPKELAMHDFHGAGPHPVDAVDVILSQGFGEGFARRMAKRGIVAAATEQTDPVEAVKTYLAVQHTGTVAAAAATYGCGHSHGHGHGHAHAHRHRHAQRPGGVSRLHRGYRVLDAERSEEEDPHG